MEFTHDDDGHFEVTYNSLKDMNPAKQSELLAKLEEQLKKTPVSILFTVEKLAVPRIVPEFWLTVTTRHAPRLCAMAVASDSMAVRAAASFFGVTNAVRRVKIEVQSYTLAERKQARAWCQQMRLKQASSAPAPAV